MEELEIIDSKGLRVRKKRLVSLKIIVILVLMILVVALSYAVVELYKFNKVKIQSLPGNPRSETQIEHSLDNTIKDKEKLEWLKSKVLGINAAEDNLKEKKDSEAKKQYEFQKEAEKMFESKLERNRNEFDSMKDAMENKVKKDKEEYYKMFEEEKDKKLKRMK